MKCFSMKEAPWLFENTLQTLLAILGEGKEEAKVVGGAVRNTLLGIPVRDIDIATTTLPEETAARAKKQGFHVIPTGIDCGTVTVIAQGHSYEITTLRTDITTDGRHARVCFGCDWKTDAERRDFTINALYAGKDGLVYDYVGGLKDIENCILRFIGNAEDRIREDYLRILRFFRFYAWFGKGRPETEGLKAVVKLKDGLGILSAERVWSELKKLLSAPDPVRSLLWMRQSGVLSILLPETEKWGIDFVHALVSVGRSLSWKPDPLLRLESIMPPDIVRIQTLSNRLKLSGSEKKRLVQWARSAPVPVDICYLEMKKRIYREGRQPVLDRMRTGYAIASGNIAGGCCSLLVADHYVKLDNFVCTWKKPVFPVCGQDLMRFGFRQGPEIGKILNKLKNVWIQSDFSSDKNSLLSLIEKKTVTRF